VLISDSFPNGITANAAYLVDAFRREAEHAMALKRVDLGDA